MSRRLSPLPQQFSSQHRLPFSPVRRRPLRRVQSTDKEGAGALHASILWQRYVCGVLCLLSWKRRQGKRPGRVRPEVRPTDLTQLAANNGGRFLRVI